MKIETVKPGLQAFFFILGLFTTLSVYIFYFGELAFTELLKGFSVQSVFDSITTNQIAELVIWFYYFFLIITLFFIPRFMYNFITGFSKDSQIFIKEMVSSFREGAIIIPLIVTIGFSLLMQLILPTLIGLVVLVEILIPIIFLSVFFNLSMKYLSLAIKEYKSDGKLSYIVRNIIIALITFPLIVFIFVSTDLDVFLTLIHYNFLWENPQSQIALTIWDGINTLIELFSFNIESILNFLNMIKYYVVTLIVLGIIAVIYNYTKKILKILSTNFTERVIYKYNL
jgi:hypothetical protein